MSKSRPFSIFLLKEGFDADNSLKSGHRLSDNVNAQALPEGASLFVLDNAPHQPWWTRYFGISTEINQVTKGALVFLPVGNRCFALCFGYAFHSLDPASYGYDFGLRVTLNCVDPEKLRSTDVLEPAAARRRRTQLPVESNLTYFDFDRDSTILKNLTGKVKDEYGALFKQVTGSTRVSFHSTVPVNELPRLCSKLLDLYQSDSYKRTFPGIRNIEPARDPVLVEKLDLKLVSALRSKSDDIYLTIPDIVDYRDNLYAMFSGAGSSLIYGDAFIDPYYDYLGTRDIELSEVETETLKRHKLVLTDENGNPSQQYPIYNCLVFDTMLSERGAAYHLADGDWYRIDTNFLAQLENFLDPLCVDLPLPAYRNKGEGEYNKSVASSEEQFVCLDRANISPEGETPVEPCDVYSVENGAAVLYHVKISTLSAKLSHLFNQGLTALESLRSEDQSVEKLKSLIRERARTERMEEFLSPLLGGRYKIAYAIVTHKDKERRSKNLPLFSRINLMRALKMLIRMNVDAVYGFVADQSKLPETRKKPRAARK